MADNYDIVDLYKYYSKGILSESKKALKESESKVTISKKYPNLFKKMNAILYFDADPNLLPTSFQVDYVYKIKFDCKKIKEDFTTDALDLNKDIDVDDDDIDKMIMKKLKGKEEKVKRTTKVDADAFYYDFFKKHIPSYSVKTKLDDLIRAGVLPIENWKIYAVTYSMQSDDNLLFRNLESVLKRNAPAYISKFGYEIAFESTNKRQHFGEEEIVKFVLDFSKALEDSIFKDTKYYTISK